MAKLFVPNFTLFSPAARAAAQPESNKFGEIVSAVASAAVPILKSVSERSDEIREGQRAKDNLIAVSKSIEETDPERSAMLSSLAESLNLNRLGRDGISSVLNMALKEAGSALSSRDQRQKSEDSITRAMMNQDAIADRSIMLEALKQQGRAEADGRRVDGKITEAFVRDDIGDQNREDTQQGRIQEIEKRNEGALERQSEKNKADLDEEKRKADAEELTRMREEARMAYDKEYKAYEKMRVNPNISKNEKLKEARRLNALAEDNKRFFGLTLQKATDIIPVAPTPTETVRISTGPEGVTTTTTRKIPSTVPKFLDGIINPQKQATPETPKTVKF
jgi:hypothetical protein